MSTPDDLTSRIDHFCFLNRKSDTFDYDYCELFGNCTHNGKHMSKLLSHFPNNPSEQEWGDFAAFVSPSFWTRNALRILLEHCPAALDQLSVGESKHVCVHLALKYYIFGSESLKSWTEDGDDDWAWEQLCDSDADQPCEFIETLVSLTQKYQDGHAEQMRSDLEDLRAQALQQERSE